MSEKESNIVNILRNIIYLTNTKIIVMCIIAALIFISSSNCLKILDLYLDNKDIVSNIYAQGSKFDYETSIPFKGEMKRCFRNILDYALKYSDVENYRFSDSIQIHIDDENNRAEEQIEIVKYLARVQIEKRDFDLEYIKNGYIEFEDLSDGTRKAKINEAAIRAHYEAVRDELIEGYKRSSDRDYDSVMTYLESLRGVSYAVVDKTSDRVITNVKDLERSQIRKFFSEKDNNIMVFNSKNPYYAATDLQNFSLTIEKLAKDYKQNFDFYASFNNGLYFNENCDGFESECNAMYGNVFSHSLKAAAGWIVILLLCLYIIKVSGKREYQGTIKYGITDNIPNDLHFLLQWIIIISMIMLMGNSFYFIFNPEAAAASFITIGKHYYILKLEVCCVVLVLMLVSFICCLKRHIKNHSVLRNTIIYRFIRIFMKNPPDIDDEDNFKPIGK